MRDASSQKKRTPWFATVSARLATVRRPAWSAVALALVGGALMGPVGCAGGSSAGRTPAGGQGEDPAAAERAYGSAPGGIPLAERPAPVDGREPDPARGLPEVSVRHIGLHVGGGPNDDATRQPILRAIEQRTQEFLWCYRQVERPLRGGVYGVDLYVPARGGNPEVRATRQRLGPPELQECMGKAFGEVNLPRPPRATVVSYSLRFDVVDPTAPPEASGEP